MLDDGEQREGHGVKKGEPVAFHQGEGAFHIEAPHEDLLGPGENEAAHDHGSVDMVEGKKIQASVVFVDSVVMDELVIVADQIPVGEHHALGAPRRPAGVGEGDEIFGLIDGRLIGRIGGLGRQPVAERDASRRGVAFGDDDLAEAGKALPQALDDGKQG